MAVLQGEFLDPRSAFLGLVQAFAGAERWVQPSVGYRPAWRSNLLISLSLALLALRVSAGLILRLLLSTLQVSPNLRLMLLLAF